MISGLTSATSRTGCLSFLSGRTTGAKVLAGGTAVAVASNLILGGHSQPTGFFGGLLKFADNVASILGIASIFCPVLTFPVAAYFGARGVMEIFSGNFLNGALQLVGALPFFGVLKAKNLLRFKGMANHLCEVDKALAESLKIGDLGNPTKALEKMGLNIQRLQREGDAAGKMFGQAAEKAQEAAKQVEKEIKELAQKGFAETKDLTGKSLTEQSRVVSRNLKAAVEGPSKEVARLQKVVDEAKELEEARKKALNLDQIQKDLTAANNRLAELKKFQGTLNGKLRAFGQTRFEAGYASKRVTAHTEILTGSQNIKTRLERLESGNPVGLEKKDGKKIFDSKEEIIGFYNENALRTTRTDYLKAAQIAVGRSYGPRSGDQFGEAVEFVRTAKKKGFHEATRNAIKSVRTCWRDILQGTAPDPVKEIAKAA